MKKPKLRELKEVIRALIAGPYTNRYPFKPHVPHKRFRGLPKYSKTCIGCTACKQVCPSGAIKSVDVVDGRHPSRRMALSYDMCNYCGNCSLWCSTRDEAPPGVSHSTEFEAAYFNRSDRAAITSTSENELALCEACGDIVATYSHLRWIAGRLDSLAYANPTVYLAELKMLGVINEDMIEAARELTRADRIKILCPACRRKSTLEK